ncbi:MAG: glycosyltransferase family 9 protein [Pseudomonadota bacterium]
MNPPPRDAINRILVIKWSAMGDLAMAGAAIEDVRMAYPAAEIDLDTLPPWDRLYRADPRFRKVHAFKLRGGGWRATRRWLRQIRSERYDLVIDLQTTDRSRIMLGMLGWLGDAIPYRAGNLNRWPYNLALPPPASEPRHALQIARDTLQAAGIAARSEYPRLHIEPGLRHSAAALLRTVGIRVDRANLSDENAFMREETAGAAPIAGYSSAPDPRFGVFLPGCQAAGYLKRWGAENYAALAHRLRAEGVAKIVLLGGPDEIDECRAIEQRCGDWVVNLCGKTELMHVPVVCEFADIVIANDTGTAHLASAANRPMVVVCGPTDPRRVLPAGRKVAPAQLNLPCINCYRKHCAHHSCMRLLFADEVFEIARDLMRREVITEFQARV